MVVKGGARFEEKSLSAVRNFYPCIHSGDFYGSDFARVASRRNRGCPDNSIGLHADENIRGKIMKVVVMKLPKFLTGITKAIFKIK